MAEGIEQGPRDRLQLLIGQAREYLLAQGVLDRRELITDHFFELVAAGGDVYILKQIMQSRATTTAGGSWPAVRAP